MAATVAKATLQSFSSLSLCERRREPWTAASCSSLSSPSSVSSGVSMRSQFLSSRSSATGSLSFLTSSFCGVELSTGSKRRAATGRSPAVIVAADDKAKKAPKKLPTVEKRAKQAEVKRIYHKSRKSEMSTRMKKAFLALDALKASPSPSPEQLEPVEKLIAEAYRIIDKSVKVGTIHANKGARRKSRLARAKRAVNIALGWYSSEPLVEGAEPATA